MAKDGMRRKIDLVVGARPNFMKAAPLLKELGRHPDQFQPRLIHTGQHYDPKMSKLFFDDLGMEPPDVFLGVGSGTHAEQTARIMVEFEKTIMANRPYLVVVFGDVNSTMAAAIVAAKLWVKIAHVEAGLRSFDNQMPEEINRIVTDRLSDYLFVTEESGLKNLKAEGVPSDRIFFTGNIMIDSLVASLEACKKSTVLADLGLVPGEFVCMTLHRPSNVDNPQKLRELIELILKIAVRTPVVFPCHPRTHKEMEHLGLFERIDADRLKIIEPLGYLDFLRLQSSCKFVLTDSGGIQEETTYLQIPCITMRESTERPVTVDVGSNVLTGPYPDKVLEAVDLILCGKHKHGKIPELWDGRTAIRIREILERQINPPAEMRITPAIAIKD
jgi:UDP-N-acetylglucosamine 2-epimerase (non-hydrolysing)